MTTVPPWATQKGNISMEIIKPPKRFFLARLLCWLGFHNYREIKSNRWDLRLLCVRDFCDEGQVAINLEDGDGGIRDQDRARRAHNESAMQHGPGREA